MKVLFFIACLFSTMLQAEPQTMRVALIVPDGTTFAQSLKKFSKEVSATTKERVQFKFLFGGIAGSDELVLESLIKKKLAGAMFSGSILSAIDPAARQLEIPFKFGKDLKKFEQALSAAEKTINEGFEKRGYTNLGFFEVGAIYLISKDPIERFASIEKAKVWQWPNDPVVKDILTELKTTAVEAPLQDVIKKLDKNEITVTYGPPMGILALQWQTKVKYLVDYPLIFAKGAFLIENSEWKKVSAADQKSIQTLAAKYLAEANAQTKTDNESALKEIAKSGVKFVPLPAGEEKRAQEIANKVEAKTMKQAK